MKMIGKEILAKYPKYKASGEEWLGKIPEGWELIRFKYLFNEINERSEDGLGDLLSVSQYTGVTRKSDKLEGGEILTTASTLEGYKKVYKNDLVSNIMLAWNGSLGFSPFNGITSPAYSVYRLNSGNSERYFHYLVRSQIYKSEFKRCSSGIIESRLRLYTDDFYNIRSLVPPLPEQTAIANFLDQKTAQIDKAIEQKEKLIELLNERKQIVIQKAVTKGLDSKSKMKESGVEWIGDIPEHWKVKRLKYLVRIIKRIIGFEGPDVLSITQKGIKVKDIKSGEGQLAQDYSNYQILNKGEFAMNHMDLLTGYVDISKFDGVVSPDYRVFVPFSNEIQHDYLLRLFQYGYKSKTFYRYGQGVSKLGRWRFPAHNFNNFFMPIPPAEEQKKIGIYLNEMEIKIDQTVASQKDQIDRLKEYRSVLIDNAVTGKLKVN